MNASQQWCLSADLAPFFSPFFHLLFGYCEEILCIFSITCGKTSLWLIGVTTNQKKLCSCFIFYLSGCQFSITNNRNNRFSYLNSLFILGDAGSSHAYQTRRRRLVQGTRGRSTGEDLHGHLSGLQVPGPRTAARKLRSTVVQRILSRCE